jgi:hypothetical protein
MPRNHRITLSQDEIEGLADRMRFDDHMMFEFMGNRDAVAAAAKQLGVAVKKSNVKNPVLDPRYTVEGRHLPNLGMANDAQAYGTLYRLERIA